MFTTLADAKEFCRSNGIMMIDLMMIDFSGKWRHLSMPAGRLTPETMKSGFGFDGSNYGYAPVEKSDMVCIPDLSTAYVDNFAELPTLGMICDVFVIDSPDNYQFDQYPRNVALNAERYLRSTGIADSIRISPEYEFYVLDHVSFSTRPESAGFRLDVAQAEWNAGKDDGTGNLGYQAPVKGGYHASPPTDRLYGFRSRLMQILEDRGVRVHYHHHEVGGPGQIEFEVEFGGLLEMCDKTLMVKHIARNLAFAERKTVTFMPKPIYGEAGSGLHVHMHLFKDAQPIFYDRSGYSELSETALYFIGGILTHASALCAFTNPSTNSYKRLTPGFEAPVTIGFAASNRSAVIRIPAYAKNPEEKRFELRSPDATCNPHYAFSAILMAGIDGVRRRIDPTREGFGPYDGNLYTLTPEERDGIKSLPRTLDEALDALERDQAFLKEGNVFPQRLIDIWLKTKRAEAARIAQIPHPAEFEMYYDL
jgi:glutamine synthetase